MPLVSQFAINAMRNRWLPPDLVPSIFFQTICMHVLHYWIDSCKEKSAKSHLIVVIRSLHCFTACWRMLMKGVENCKISYVIFNLLKSYVSRLSHKCIEHWVSEWAATAAAVDTKIVISQQVVRQRIVYKGGKSDSFTFSSTATTTLELVSIQQTATCQPFPWCGVERFLSHWIMRKMENNYKSHWIGQHLRGKWEHGKYRRSN